MHKMLFQSLAVFLHSPHMSSQKAHPSQVLDAQHCIYDEQLVECNRIDAFQRTRTQIDDALAQQVMQWRPSANKQYWMQESNNDCTGYVRFFSADAMPDVATIWQPTRNVPQARMCLDWMANAPETRNGFGRPRVWLSFQITPFHVIVSTHDQKRMLFCASYAMDGSDLDWRFAIGVLVSHSIVYNECVRKSKKRTAEQHTEEDETTLAFDVPDYYLEQLRHECTGRPDERIDENTRRKRQAIADYYSKTTRALPLAEPLAEIPQERLL